MAQPKKTEALKMPERTEIDGPAGVRLEDDLVVLEAKTGDRWDTMIVSRFNAWRLFGFMSILLGIPLSKAAKKAIVFGTPGKKLDNGAEASISFASKDGSRRANFLFVGKTPAQEEGAPDDHGAIIVDEPHHKPRPKRAKK